MCGICGAAWTEPSRAISDRDLAAMTDRLTHRGPDDSGAYRDDHAALGFRRLSIVDLAGGHQPLSNEDGTVWTVFNGEIYNFPALRHRLEAKGHTLRSSGDTEVLVHLYEDEGPGFPEGFDLSQSTGLGSRLIYSLVRADEGSVEIADAEPEDVKRRRALADVHRNIPSTALSNSHQFSLRIRRQLVMQPAQHALR